MLCVEQANVFGGFSRISISKEDGKMKSAFYFFVLFSLVSSFFYVVVVVLALVRSSVCVCVFSFWSEKSICHVCIVWLLAFEMNFQCAQRCRS